MTTQADWRLQLAEDGYAVLSGVFTADTDALIESLEGALRERAGDASIRSEDGTIYAARNLVEVWPTARTFWRRPPLLEALTAVLGPRFGLVRTLFFDKPPGQTWALPWHKDLTIAVRDHRLPSTQFLHPTRKVGVPHVEAPRIILEAMLTVRVHLDETTEENGALQVVPGSHLTGKELTLDVSQARTIRVERGGVLLMRPLLAHCSGKSFPETNRHRRVVHLEFAAEPELPDGYAWYDFLPGLTPDEERQEAPRDCPILVKTQRARGASQGRAPRFSGEGRSPLAGAAGSLALLRPSRTVSQIGYLLSILEGMTDRISSIPTTYPLDGTNLPLLYDEVEKFWSSRDMRRRTSIFSAGRTAHE